MGPSLRTVPCLAKSSRLQARARPARHAQGRRLQAIAVCRHRRQQSSTPPCAVLPMIARRWSSFAATSRARPRTEDRVQTNAAGQVVLRLKTPWRDGTTHLVMSPLEFMQRLAAWATEGAPARRPCHAPDCTTPHRPENPETAATDDALSGCGRPSTGRCRTGTQGPHQWVFKSIDGGLWDRECV